MTSRPNIPFRALAAKEPGSPTTTGGEELAYGIQPTKSSSASVLLPGPPPPVRPRPSHTNPPPVGIPPPGIGGAIPSLTVAPSSGTASPSPLSSLPSPLPPGPSLSVTSPSPSLSVASVTPPQLSPGRTTAIGAVVPPRPIRFPTGINSSTAEFSDTPASYSSLPTILSPVVPPPPPPLEPSPVDPAAIEAAAAGASARSRRDQRFARQNRRSRSLLALKDAMTAEELENEMTKKPGTSATTESSVPSTTQRFDPRLAPAIPYLPPPSSSSSSTISTTTTTSSSSSTTGSASISPAATAAYLSASHQEGSRTTEATRHRPSIAEIAAASRLNGERPLGGSVIQMPVSPGVPPLRTRAQTRIQRVSTIPEERKLVIHELIISEHRYVQDLALVRTLFLEPIRKNKMLDLREFGMLFSNVELIEQANQDLLRELERQVMENDDLLQLCVGELFLRHIQNLLPIYTPYCLNQAQSVETYEKLMSKKGSAFAEFVKQMMVDPKAHGLPMMSYLIKPVQRLCKYPLLLRELLNKTNNSHPDRKPLEEALLQTNTLVVQVNESKRAAENLRKLLQIDRIVEKRHNLKIVVPGRFFIKEGKLVKLTHGQHQERQFYLFNDMLMWAKPVAMKNTFEFKGFVFLNRSALSDASATVEHGFYITRNDTQKRYVVYAKDAKEKKEWFTALQNAIQESWNDEALALSTASLSSSSSSSTTPLSSSSSSLSSSSSPSSSTTSSSIGSSSTPSAAAFTIQRSGEAPTAEDVLRMVDVENRIQGFSNSVRDRKFIREGPCTLKGKNRYLFLFNDLAIVTSKKSIKIYHKKMEIKLATLVVKQTTATTLEWVIPRNVLEIVFPSTSSTLEWITDLTPLVPALSLMPSS